MPCSRAIVERHRVLPGRELGRAVRVVAETLALVCEEPPDIGPDRLT
jgi:hypothetical protein